MGHARTMKGNKQLYSLKSPMKSKYGSRQHKQKIHRTVIESTVTCALNKVKEETLERKKTENGWERRNN